MGMHQTVHLQTDGYLILLKQARLEVHFEEVWEALR